MRRRKPRKKINQQQVTQTKIRIPIFLERVQANFSRRPIDIGMENFGQKSTYWGSCGIVVAKLEGNLELTTNERSVGGSIKNSMQLSGDVIEKKKSPANQ